MPLSAQLQSSNCPKSSSPNLAIFRTMKFLVVFSLYFLTFTNGVKEHDQIKELPGQPKVAFAQYSGHVTVDVSAGRALLYYLAEAENASSKPLLLWLNGGPGCSSVGIGALSELGPFRVNSDKKTLRHNHYSWNRVANVLFLESPAGTGFSYSNRTSDYATGDKQTAADSYTFLTKWVKRFPEYRGRDFYIAGDSYAGHYVPQLAELILQHKNVTAVNLKGIALGNADMDYESVWNGKYQHLWSSARISDELYTAIQLNCDFTSPATRSEVCKQCILRVNEERGFLDFYDIFARTCASNSTDPSMTSFDPCTQSYVEAYMNMAEVQKAFHANTTGLPGPWQYCNFPRISDHWQDRPLTVIPIIRQLMANDIRVWIYSGDTDPIHPTISTRYTMTKIGAPVKTPWYPWYYHGEVGGYVVGYENVTFVVIRGAGHFVPSYQPERALAFFSNYIEGKLPPSQK